MLLPGCGLSPERLFWVGTVERAMSANERGDPVAGPFGNLSAAWCGGLDQLVKGYEPTLRNAGRINLELMGLMTRRAQAWLELPAGGQCKTPAGSGRAQLRFWQTAAQDYTEGARRLAATFARLPGRASTAHGVGARSQRRATTSPSLSPSAELRRPAKHDRRAA